MLELQTAKEILAVIFRARPEDIEDMIRRRLDERSCHEEDQWPAAFSLERRKKYDKLQATSSLQPDLQRPRPIILSANNGQTKR